MWYTFIRKFETYRKYLSLSCLRAYGNIMPLSSVLKGILVFKGVGSVFSGPLLHHSSNFIIVPAAASSLLVPQFLPIFCRFSRLFHPVTSRESWAAITWDKTFPFAAAKLPCPSPLLWSWSLGCCDSTFPSVLSVLGRNV